MIKKCSLLILLAISLQVHSQMTTKSPYSYYGIGETNKQYSVASAGMGGISVALDGVHELNFMNPALLSNVKFTVFDLGGKTEFLTLKDASQSQHSSTTTLSYLALGFPISKNMGFTMGLQPNSSVGYNIIQEYKETDELVEANIYNGNGGTNRFFLGTGYKIYKGLSIGAEAEFLFGKIENNVINQRADVQLYTRYKTQTQLNGSAFKVGVSYQDKLTDKLQFKAETSVKFGNTIKTLSSEHFYTFTYNSSGIEVPQDTLLSNENLKGKVKRPVYFHSGIGVGNSDKWFAGIEYNQQDALNFNDPILDNSKIQYPTYSQLLLGGYYIPKKNSITNYWQRVTYRVGARIEKPGMAFNLTNSGGAFQEIKDFGISFGLGLPIGNQLTKLNVSAEFGKRGTTNLGLIQENYINLRFGLNLADKWFQKNKIN